MSSSAYINTLTPVLDPVAWFRSLPPAPGWDASKIEGNISLEDKQLNANVLGYFMAQPPWFGSSIRVTPIKINVYFDPGETRAESECEILVTQEMCNVYKTVHGACHALLVDTCSSIPIVAIGIAEKRDTSGMSQAMNFIYHNPAMLGSTLLIKAGSLATRGRILASRCEIYDKKTNRIIVSAVHTKIAVPPGGKRTKTASKL